MAHISTDDRQTVIIDGLRTPFGKLAGALSTVSAVDLAAALLRELASRYSLLDRPASELIDEVIIGQVLQAGCGQIPSRQALFKAGLPVTCESTTVNKVCASGMRAVTLADIRIRAGEGQVIFAGGMESMSQAPYLVEANIARFGKRMGHGQFKDSILTDGLECPVTRSHMAIYGSAMAQEFGISREEQDEFALRSQQRAIIAQKNGRFAQETLPISVVNNKGLTSVISEDEAPRGDTTLEGLRMLKPIFDESGSVTAGNAPGVNDGAAMLLLMSAAKARELGLKPLAKIVGQASLGQEVQYLATVPALACQKAIRALNSSGVSITVDSLGLLEINEAFASVALKSMAMLGVSPEIVNVNGGAIALGHPIGASGARIILTLAKEMQLRGIEYGAAAICSGTGQGDCIILSRQGI